jgi:O-antigen/teichoic acid export membrane protein
MAKRDSLAKNTLLLSIGTFMTKGLSFVMVPFFSRWLSTADYGTYDLLATYVTLLLPIIGLASNEALFRFSMDVETKEEKAKYVSNCLAIFSISSLVLFTVLVVLRFVVGWKLALYFFVLAIGEVYNLHLRGFLRAIKHLDIYSFVSAISTVFIAVFSTIFIKGFGLGLEGMLLGYGFGYIAGDLIIIILTKYWMYVSLKKVSLSGMSELVKYSYALIPNSLAWWFINVSDRTIIKIFFGAASNGIYAIAYKIPNILSSVFSVFSVSWQQSATEVLNDNDRDKYYNKIYNKMSLILMSLCCGILSLNSWLFNYIFDLKYYEGHLYAPILIGGTVFATLSQFYGSIQISLKRPKENGITTIIGALSNLIIHLALIKFVGLYAAAFSTILSQVVVCVLRNIRLKKIVNLRFDKRTVLFFAVYIYFTAMAYYITNPIVNISDAVLATILVIWVNKDYANRILKKLRKNR